MIKALCMAEIVMFGETHDNVIAHWLEFEVTKDLAQSKKLVLGAEMFEADNQIPLNQYLDGTIDDKGLDTLARLWPNYNTDYAPLVQFAKENKLPFIATNIPRRYARIVSKNNFDALNTLTAEEKAWIAPLPIAYDPELPGYKKMAGMGAGMGNAMPGHSIPYIAQAQAVKDATMAYFILKNHKKDNIFIHYNGCYHSDYHDGIFWHLMQKNPDLKIATISTVSQANFDELEEEYKGKADFIICVDEDMTKSY
jgi:uncharacterized iron-regulated protein